MKRSKYKEILLLAEFMCSNVIPFEIVECWGGFRILYPIGTVGRCILRAEQSSVSVGGSEGKIELRVNGQPPQYTSAPAAFNIINNIHSRRMAELRKEA